MHPSRPMVAIGLVAFSFLWLPALAAQRDPALLAHYTFEGNLKDVSGNRNHLTPVSGEPAFSADTALKKGSNTVLGPSSGKSFGGAEAKVLRPSIKSGITLCCFVAKPGGHDYGCDLLGFGVNDWGKPRLLLSLPSGAVAASVGRGRVQQHKRILGRGWRHVALVVPPKGSRSSEYLLYVDGNEVMTGPVERLPKYGTFRLGVLGGKQRDGLLIDEVKVFKRALSAEELAREAKQHGQPPVVAKRPWPPVAKEIRHRNVPPLSEVKIKGELQVRFLTRNWICVVGDYNDFIRERFSREGKEFFTELDRRREQTLAWSYDFHYRFGVQATVADYRPRIRDNFCNPKYFRVRASGGKRIGVAANAYWVNAIGAMRVKTTDGRTRQTDSAAVAHFAYLRLAEPLTDGARYTLDTAGGEQVVFTYDERKCLSRAIKVNQVGYLPDAARKYAYLGMWLGDAGPLDLSAWDGREFHIVTADGGETAFTGRIRLRAKERLAKTIPIPMYGEDVYEMDFSGLRNSGRFHVYVPGVGRSWEFRIDGDVVGEAFYTHARGLFHQRCGMAKEAPWTRWPMGACHRQTWLGGFAPEVGHYRSGKRMFDENGNGVSLSTFTMVAETTTEKRLPNVWGGWHDAADYDRRPPHFGVVRDLLTAYLLFPAKFPDGQLNIPESGNGLPDVVDEAVWGVDVWRRAQNAKGGVGCWIEATSHPRNNNPSTDEQRYYLALPTRESTMDYAAHAALLALALKRCGDTERSALFLRSARRAYVYAEDPDNTVDVRWKHTKNPDERDPAKRQVVEYRYREAHQIPRARAFKAALNLYMLTGDDRYVRAMKEKYHVGSKDVLARMHSYSPFYLAEIHLADGLDGYKRNYKKRVLELAEERLALQEEHAYRNSFWSIDHDNVKRMSWGAVHPLRFGGRFFVLAWHMTGRNEFRDAALLLNDWTCGTNPLGRTMTTGLGQVALVRLLHYQSDSDGVAEPVPGITPYFYTFGAAYSAHTRVHSLYLGARLDHGFTGRSICLLPDSMRTGVDMSLEDAREAVFKVYPVWRRFTNLEWLEPAQNEFTVDGTISPNAAVTGCLLPDGWMPSDRLLTRRPVDDERKLPGYIAQP